MHLTPLFNTPSMYCTCTLFYMNKMVFAGQVHVHVHVRTSCMYIPMENLLECTCSDVHVHVLM